VSHLTMPIRGVSRIQGTTEGGLRASTESGV
jgi:hypothetical protein